jgi:hypothetical protein
MAAARAEGYAEAVEDIREMVTELDGLSDPSEAGSGVFELILSKLVSGAHVGAAKKGGVP